MDALDLEFDSLSEALLKGEVIQVSPKWVCSSYIKIGQDKWLTCMMFPGHKRAHGSCADGGWTFWGTGVNGV
jgi:hypothetical protein